MDTYVGTSKLAFGGGPDGVSLAAVGRVDLPSVVRWVRRYGHEAGMRIPFLLALVGLLPACSGSGDIGAPCLPTPEDDPMFDGFTLGSIGIEGTSDSGVCLVNHFQGLVTCPYGQSATGKAPAGASPCTTLDGEPVVGAVSPQCANRPASTAVFWSCECANADAQTNDGNTYCTCPSGTTCVPLTTSNGNNGLEGEYCMAPASLYTGTPCVECNPKTMPCP
jgi:hypothetical protein